MFIKLFKFYTTMVKKLRNLIVLKEVTSKGCNSNVFLNNNTRNGALDQRAEGSQKRNFFMIKGWLLMLAFFVFSFGVKAQVSSYTFTATSGTYSAITGGTTLIASGQDDATSSLTSIGFNFSYNGTTFTSFSAHSNGFVELGVAASPYTYYPLDDPACTNCISFLGNDARTGGTVTYLLQGTAPNRYLTVQFPTWNIDYATTAYYIDVQVILYETTNAVKIVYGTSSMGGFYYPEVGINGAAYTDFNVRTTTTDWSASSAATLNYETMDLNSSVYPASGLTYTFEQPACTTPSNQPTALNLTPSLTSISGSFTAATSAPTGYLVIRTATSTAPTAPANGTSYTVGTAALGGIVISQGASTTFVSSGLTPGTTYYYWVYSYNGSCSGAPNYRTASPLSQNVATSSCSVAGTKSVGPTGTYASITDALTALSNNGLASSVILELQSTYNSSVETFPINISAMACLSATNTLTIRPATGASALSITSSSATGTINLNGVSFVTIDGRAGGAGASQLTIANTSATGYSLQLINSAMRNTIKYCALEGVNTGLASGVVLFGNATGLTTGNSNNTIDNCDLRSGATTATNLIYASGNTADYNSSNILNTISNSLIHDWFNASTTGTSINASTMSGGAGINIAGGASDWTITGNSFYQSATRTFTMIVATTGVDQNAIFVNSPVFGSNFTISNNYFGGSAASCGGGPWVYTTSTGTPTLRMISLITATGAFSNITGNTFANLSITTATPSTRCGLVVHQSGNINVINNTFGSQTATGNITFTITSTSSIFFLPIGCGTNTLAPSAINIRNNNIGGITVNATNTTGNASLRLLYAAPANVGSIVKITNNTAGGTVANSILQQTNSQIFGSLILNPSIGDSISNNTIRNLTQDNTGVTGAVSGVNVQAGGGRHTITGNTIYNLTSNGTNTSGNNAASVVGITMTNNLYGPNTISGNTVYGLSNTNSTIAAYVVGITAQTPAYPQDHLTMSNNFVHSLNVASATGTIMGLFLPFGGTEVVSNNMVRLGLDASGASITTSAQITGIYKAHGNNAGIYNNSVYIGGTGVASGAVNTYAFRRLASGTMDTVANNIFYNARSNASGTGINYGINLSANSAILCNNNDILANGTGGVFGNYAIDYTTLAAWRTATGLDGSSVSSDPKFLTPNGSSSTVDLHINTASATAVESSGINFANVTTDYDGQARSGLTPTDIGADAGNFTLQDLTPPVILFTPLLYSCSTGDRTLAGVVINDATGIPTTGTTIPRIYYKKNAGSYFSRPGTLVSGTATSSIWSFTIIASDMSGLAVTDVVSYFVIAQDVVGPYIASNSAGVVASDVNTITTPPATLNTYSIVNSLVSSGNYNVGAGQTFTTLTSAVAAYNAGCMSGPITFTLTDASYSASETFPITITANPYASSTNTLTIKPSGSTSISGSSTTALIVLNGADWVTINGSSSATANAVCPVSTASRNLTLTNTNAGTTTAVVWLQTNPSNVLDGASNNTIMNVNIVGSGNSQTLVGIGSGSSTIATTSLGTRNNNNSMINNDIRSSQYGIYSQGLNVGSKNTGNIISQNLINAASPNNVRNGGVLIGFEDNITIAGNTISEIANVSSTDAFGIALGGVSIVTSSTFAGNEVSNALITKNIIGTVRNTGTYSACGIYVASVWTGTNTISNNMISGVSANGTGGDFSVGMLIGGGMGSVTKIYNNTITMTSAIANTGSSDKSYALAIGGNDPVVEVINNILYNTQNNGSGNNYAVAYGYRPQSSLVSSNNNYSVGTGSQFYIGAVNSISAPVSLLTITDLQAITFKDGAAQTVTPVFVSTTDLHLSASDVINICLNGAGTPLASITNDIDCQTRSNPSDLGADEFTPTSFVVTNPASICPGGSFNLTAAAVTAGSQSGLTYTYWNDAAATSALSTPASVTVGGTYYIKAVNANGCTIILPVTVSFYPVPTAPTVTTPANYCLNATSTPLTATAGSGNTLHWYTVSVGGVGSTTAPSPLTSALGTTFYYVSQTNSAGCEGPRATIAAVVNPIPGLPSVTTPVTYCQNATASALSATATAGNSPNWYTVSVGGTPSSTAITPSTATAGTFTYYVAQVTPQGCESARAAIQVIVNAATAITTQPISVTQCAGTTAVFNVTAIGTGTISYQWYKNAVVISAATSSSYTLTNISFADSANYTVVVSSSCGSNITSNAAKLTIASVTPTISPASVLLCQGGSVTLQASPVGASVVSYQWKSAGVNISGATGSTLVVTTLGTYSVTAFYVGGCNNTSATTPVTVAAKPTAAFSVNNGVQCVNGNSFTFTNSSSISSGTITYLWRFGDGSTSNATSPVKTYAAFGGYTVQLVAISDNGCRDSVSKFVSVNPKPSPAFTINNNSQCLSTNSFVFTNTTSMVSGSATYLWSFGDGTTSTASNPSKTYGTSNTFSVKLVVTSNFGCADSTTQTVTVNPNPVAAVPTGATSVCSSVNAVSATAVTYTSTLVSGMNYAWTVGGGTISGSASGVNQNSVNIIWGAAGTGSVTVTVTNTVTSCSGSATLSGITINPSPTAIVAGATAACLNSTNYYSLSNTSGGTITGYSWTVTGGTITAGQGTSGVTVNWPSTGAKTISCILTNSNGCQGTTPVFAVTINANPTATFTGTTTVCTSTPYIYTASSSGSTYTWTANGGTITNQSTNTVTVVWSNVSTASLVLVEKFAATTCSASTTQTITVTGPLNVVASGPTEVCNNSTQTYTLTGATPTGLIVTGGTVLSVTGSTASILWNTVGTQTLTGSYTNGTCTYNVVYTVNVNALPTPAVTGVNSVCTGTTTSYSTTSNPGRNYAWAVSSGGTISAGQGTNVISVLWNTAGANTVSITETIVATGCSTTSSALNVNVAVTPSSAIAGSNNVCSGGSFTYTSAPSATSYAWTVTGGTISGSATTSLVSIVWGTGTSGLVSLVTSNGICTSTSTFATMINATPAPSISGASAICSGSANVYSTSFNSNYTYTWTVLNGAYSYGGNTSTINVTPTTGASSVTVSVVASLNGTPCSGSSTKVITVNTTPAVSITGNTSACQNSSQVYTGVGASTYTFSVSGGVITSTTATTATITWGSGTGMVSVIGTSAAGCSSSSMLPVTINALPSSVITGLSQACANNSGSYSVTSQIGASYLWTATGGTISGGSTNNTVTVNWGASGAGTINVTVTSSLGCVSTRTMNININTQPTPSISGSATVCQNTNQSYSITAIAGAAYNWSVVGGTITTGAGTNSVSVNWTIAGAGQLSVSQSTGSCMASSSISVTVNAAPAIPTVYKVGNVLSTTTVATSYQWYNGAAAVGTGTTYTATAAGIYTLVVTNAAGCTTSSSGVLANVGIKSSRSLSNVTVYPNPTKDMIMISATLNKSQSVTVKIFDMNGKLVFNTSQNNADANYSKTISLAGYASGVYMVQVITNDGSVQQRIVKE